MPATRGLPLMFSVSRPGNHMARASTSPQFDRRLSWSPRCLRWRIGRSTSVDMLVKRFDVSTRRPSLTYKKDVLVRCRVDNYAVNTVFDVLKGIIAIMISLHSSRALPSKFNVSSTVLEINEVCPSSLPSFLISLYPSSK